jgi:hypothetical protein
MRYQPSDEQIDMLSANMNDLALLPDWEDFPDTTMTPCTPEMVGWFTESMERNACYINAYRVVAELHLRSGFTDAQYVVGIMEGRMVPICHAWVKIAGKYYDPTVELLNPDRELGVYYPMAELDVADMQAITMMNDMAPPHPCLIATEFPELLLERVV